MKPLMPIAPKLPRAGYTGKCVPTTANEDGYTFNRSSIHATVSSPSVRRSDARIKNCVFVREIIPPRVCAQGIAIPCFVPVKA